jgi:hypothetical protein
VSRKTQEELEDILSVYPEGTDYYYYNVVSWLDRILYAPPKLRSISRDKLLENVQTPI